MKISLGSDHAGLALKREVAAYLGSHGHEVLDRGSNTTDSVDYPDFAHLVCLDVVGGQAERGILICGTGIGMSIAANKHAGIRAALCHDTFSARATREHNDSNVLCLGQRVLGGGLALDIVAVWLGGTFTGGKHRQRLTKITSLEEKQLVPLASSISNNKGERNMSLRAIDPEIAGVLEREMQRQQNHLELIASENFVSKAVLEAMGSVLTNKYAEGYPGKRYYGGCHVVDDAEDLARDRACKLFGADHANVQPHSGAQANMAVYFSCLNLGDTVLGMNLSHGGHLTHGSPVNFSGLLYKFIPYGVSTGGYINYHEVEQLALTHRPKLLVAGASAYPRVIDFKRLREIADASGALFMVDMAHVAGLVATGHHPSPVPFAHFVTTTTHKTLRGPRGGMILCTAEWAKAIDKAVFPGMQGGPLMHIIAAKAVSFLEAMQPEFHSYQDQIIKNASALASALKGRGFNLVSDGTDNHLMLVDLRNKKLTGKKAEKILDSVGITVNKNTIPFDPEGPFTTSGIRIGTPAMTSRGMTEDAMGKIAGLIADALEHPTDEAVLAAVRIGVADLCREFPLYESAT